jgi:hypothetical protein
MDELKKFDKAKAEVALHIEKIKAIVVDNETSLGDAKLTVKAAIEAEKLIENKRVELVAPHLESQRAINSYAKELTLPLQASISEGKKAILVFEQEKERSRLAELKKIEDERREREEADRKETFRVDTLKNKLHLFANKTIAAINNTKTLEEIAQVENSLKMYSVSETVFQEFCNEASTIKSQMLEKVSKHREYLTDKIEQEQESLKLAGIAKEQADLKIAQEAEARKLKEEGERIAREREELEKKKADEEEAFQRKIKADREELERKEKEKALEAEKSKNMRKDWGFEIINSALVPREFLVVDEQMVKNAIKKGIREIPGVSIFQKDVVVIR